MAADEIPNVPSDNPEVIPAQPQKTYDKWFMTNYNLQKIYEVSHLNFNILDIIYKFRYFSLLYIMYFHDSLTLSTYIFIMIMPVVCRTKTG